MKRSFFRWPLWLGLAATCGLWGCEREAGRPSGDAAAAADAAPATYAASGIIGALNRIVITKADPERDFCVGVVVVSPAPSDSLEIILPPDLGIELTYFYLGADICHERGAIPDGAVSGTSGLGTISWEDTGAAFPSFLSLDITVEFASLHPWVPDRVELSAVNLSVM